MVFKFPRLAFLLAAYIFLFPFLSSRLDARWGLEEDADVECLYSNATIKVDKFGKWTVELERQLKILHEGARDESVQVFTYDATRSTFEILEAKSSTNGKEYVVPKEKMEDKSLASDPSGLKDDHQILVPFEQVDVGSILHLRIKFSYLKSDIESYFNYGIKFDRDDLWGNIDKYLWQDMNVTVHSELPLLFKINDPKNVLEITERKEQDNQILQIKLKKPFIESLIGEETCLDPETKTFVSISTEKDFLRIGKILGEKYNPILTSPLPEALDEIRSIASKDNEETHQIDKVVSLLIKKINYLGNWNSAEGHYIPRTLEEIVRTGYGDCKDYSITLAAILNSLGYKARVAAVRRGLFYLEDNTLPGLNHFNHVIVNVVGPSGTIRWIDPTNITTMANGIYPDIADRPALVLNSETPTYEHIPPVDYRHSKLEWKQTTTINDEGNVVNQGSSSWQGESGLGLTQYLLTNPASVARDYLLKQYCKSGDPINTSLTIPHVSAKVQDLIVNYRFEEANTLILTNLGYAYPLNTTFQTPYVNTFQQQVGCKFIGHPETKIRKLFIKNATAKDLDSLAFSFQTPWLNAKRELKSSDEGITVTETIEQLKSVISAKDVRTPEFQMLKNTLRKYCEGAAIILSQLKNKKED